MVLLAKGTVTVAGESAVRLRYAGLENYYDSSGHDLAAYTGSIKHGLEAEMAFIKAKNEGHCAVIERAKVIRRRLLRYEWYLVGGSMVYRVEGKDAFMVPAGVPPGFEATTRC